MEQNSAQTGQDSGQDWTVLERSHYIQYTPTLHHFLISPLSSYHSLLTPHCSSLFTLLCLSPSNCLPFKKHSFHFDKEGRCGGGGRWNWCKVLIWWLLNSYSLPLLLSWLLYSCCVCSCQISVLFIFYQKLHISGHYSSWDFISINSLW